MGVPVTDILQLPFGVKMSVSALLMLVGEILMWAGGIIFLVSLVLHFVRRNADKKAAAKQEKGVETEHKRKGASAAGMAAQHAEKGPAQTTETNKTDSYEVTGWQKNMQNQLNIISSRVSHLFYMNKDAENRINGTKFEDYVKSKFRNPKQTPDIYRVGRTAPSE